MLNFIIDVAVNLLFFVSGWMLSKARHHKFMARGWRYLADLNRPVDGVDVLVAFGGKKYREHFSEVSLRR